MIQKRHFLFTIILLTAIASADSRVLITLKNPSLSSQGSSAYLQEFAYSLGKPAHIYPQTDQFTIDISEEKIRELESNLFLTISHIQRIKASLYDTVNITNASRVWNIESSGINLTGEGETVCVLDTGVNFNNPYLQGKNVLCNVDCVDKNCTENCSISDDNGHGTHVAGIIAANGTLNGLAPGAKILAVKVLGSNGYGNETDLKAGFDFCMNNSAAYNISAISMSVGTESDHWSTPCDNLYTWDSNLTQSVNRAISLNISIFAASGNENNKNAMSWPACITNMTSVASSSKSDTMSSFANTNNFTDLVAPGESIISTCVSGVTCTKTGTSMSTPAVAAASILLRQWKRLEVGRILTPFQIENTLKATGKNLTDTNNLNFSRINVYAAILSMHNITTAQIYPLNGTQTNQTINISCESSTNSSASLSNTTLLVFNLSSSQIFSQTKNSTGIYNITAFNISFSEGTYFWSCHAKDNRGYNATSSNISIIFDTTPPNITILSPLSALYNSTFINITTNEPTSCLYSIDSTNQSLQNVNTTLFTTTNTTLTDGNYTLIVTCNDSAGNRNSSMRIFTINTTTPSIILQEPNNLFSTTPSTITFFYNISHGRNITSCSLILNNQINLTNSSINILSINNFSLGLSDNTYSWSINCTDDIGNQGNSTSRNLTISTPPTTQPINNLGGGGGGGGRPATVLEKIISSQSLSQGITQIIEQSARIKFILTENHSLNITSLSKTHATIVFQSQPQTITLTIGENSSLDLDNDFFYDLFIKLNSINGSKANLTLKSIHIQIQQPQKVNPITQINETNPQQPPKKENRPKPQSYKSILVIISIILTVSLFILFLAIKHKPKTIYKKISSPKYGKETQTFIKRR